MHPNPYQNRKKKNPICKPRGHGGRRCSVWGRWGSSLDQRSRVASGPAWISPSAPANRYDGTNVSADAWWGQEGPGWLLPAGEEPGDKQGFIPAVSHTVMLSKHTLKSVHIRTAQTEESCKCCVNPGRVLGVMVRRLKRLNYGNKSHNIVTLVS